MYKTNVIDLNIYVVTRYHPAFLHTNIYRWLKLAFFQFYDLNDFYAEKNPARGRIARMQTFWFWKKFENYCTACLHLLSTGKLPIKFCNRTFCILTFKEIFADKFSRPEMYTVLLCLFKLKYRL